MVTITLSSISCSIKVTGQKGDEYDRPAAPPVLDSAVEKWTIDIYCCNSMEAISGRLM